MQRLSAIKDHIAHLRQEGRNHQAGTTGRTLRVEALTDYTNSYFQRERKINLGVAKFGTANAALRDMGY